MQSDERDQVAIPRVAMFLPIVLLLHQAEEWFWGFPDWTHRALGSDLSNGAFITINTIGLLIFGIGTLAAFYNRRMAWIVVSLSSLIGLNGIIHIAFTVGLGYYSPGAISGLLLSIPFSAIILTKMGKQLPGFTFVGAVALGILLHALATHSALS